MNRVTLRFEVDITFDTLDEINDQDLLQIKNEVVDICKFKINSTLNDVLEELEIESETMSPVSIDGVEIQKQE